jgi:anti-sigma factor RsiW
MKGFACWNTQRRLGGYADGELGPAARARTAAHVNGCARCASELAALGRLRAMLTGASVPDPGDTVWEAFWPQVRMRLAAPAESERVAPPMPRWWESITGHPRVALGSALAVAAVALLAVLPSWTPWPAPPSGLSVEPPAGAPTIAMPPAGSAPASGGLPALLPVSNVVVQALETEDADSEVMVFANEEPGATVVWVFGLERT